MKNSVGFVDNADFLSASLALVDQCISSAIALRKEGLSQPRGLAVTAEMAAEALASRPVGDAKLRQAYRSWASRVEACAQAPALEQLCRLLELTPFARFCALLALSTAMDRKYELLFAYLNDNLQQPWPSLGCAKALWRMFAEADEAETAAFFQNTDSGNAYLFELPEETGLNAPLRLREKARLVALGSGALSRAVGAYATLLEPDASPLAYGLEENRLPELLMGLLDGEENAVVQLLGESGAGRKRLLRHVAANTGLQLLCVRCDRLPAGAEEGRRAGLDLAAEALLGGALVLLDGADAPGVNAAARDAAVDELGRRLKVTLVSAKEPLQLPPGPLQLQLAFPLPKPAQAQRLWEDALAGYDCEALSPRELADKYALTPGRVHELLRRAALDAALAGEERLSFKRIATEVRESATHRMEGQARRINAFYTWEDLVVAPETERELRLFCNRVRYRGRVMEDWNFKSKLAYGRAVSALFYGVPGTGKTMAAQVIANDLDLDLYRVDLSQIINKYVGETEKNLARIFDEAAHCAGILFFDEADALFAKRTEIADSKDKYANAETAFLLQKIEEFDGLVILATNLAYNFDDAFKRRINYMVNFTLPDLAQRKELWRKVFPPQVRAQERLDLDFLAASFELTGSTIKAIAVSAAYMAAAEGEEIAMRHIIRALKHEYAKSGGILIKAKLREYDVE